MIFSLRTQQLSLFLDNISSNYSWAKNYSLLDYQPFYVFYPLFQLVKPVTGGNIGLVQVEYVLAGLVASLGLRAL